MISGHQTKPRAVVAFLFVASTWLFPASASEKSELVSAPDLVEKKPQIDVETPELRALVREHLQRIHAKVRANWVVWPPDAKAIKATIRVKLLSSGEVSGVYVIRESGNPKYDQSAVAAVWRASPLPIPTNAELYTYFKVLDIVFAPLND